MKTTLSSAPEGARMKTKTSRRNALPLFNPRKTALLPELARRAQALGPGAKFLASRIPPVSGEVLDCEVLAQRADPTWHLFGSILVQVTSNVTCTIFGYLVPEEVDGRGVLALSVADSEEGYVELDRTGGRLFGVILSDHYSGSLLAISHDPLFELYDRARNQG